MDYIYSPENFNFTLENHLEYNHVSLSKFDQEIHTRWTDAMSKGYFKYKLNDLETRIIPGRRGYIAQLNPQRFTEKRKAQNIQSVNQNFDPSKFNFTKIAKQEVLLYPIGSHWSASKPVTPSTTSLTDIFKHDENMIIVNVSPLEFGHCLIVPQVNHVYRQAVTTFGLTLSLECLLLSKHPGFRIGFNSLCAMASVNHQHYHCYYLNQQLPVEKCNVLKLSDSMYELTDWPVRGFVFQLEGHTISSFVEIISLSIARGEKDGDLAPLSDYKQCIRGLWRDREAERETFSRIIIKITKFFQEASIAHNLLLSRGSVFGTSGRNHSPNTVRAYLWPRKKFKGAKELDIFNVALVEMGGQLPIKDKDSYQKLSEQMVDETISSASFTEPEFEDLKRRIFALL